MIYRIEGKFNSKDNTFTYTLIESNKTFTDFNNDNFMNDYICRSKGIFYTYLFNKEELKEWLNRCIYKPIRIFEDAI